MFSRRVRAFWPLALLAQPSVFSQSVVSIHAGVIHYFEGSVSVDGRPLEQKFGRFYEMNSGTELRTDQGRAEVLLAPGTVLRVDENSSIRLLSNRLTDPCVEFIGGSAILDSLHSASDAFVTIRYKGNEVVIRKTGHYRLNSAPAELRVTDGEAEVVWDNSSIAISAGYTLAFTPVLTPGLIDDNSDDPLDRWARDRARSISAMNASAAATDDMSNALDTVQSASYDAGLTPSWQPAGDLLGGSAGSTYTTPLSPYSVFSGSVLGYGYIPVFRRWQSVPAYRPLFPLRSGGFGLSAPWRPPSRITPTAPSRPISPGTMPHIGGHPIGHR